MNEEEKKKNAVKVSMSFTDCPLWVVKKFKEDIVSTYDNIYWIKLMDLLRKAEAYDLFVESGVLYTPAEEVKEEEPQEEEQKVQTFSGGRK